MPKLTHIRKKLAQENSQSTHHEIHEGKRSWENMYRNRWAHDKVVRSTHGVNCTGSCSWNIYVKNGIVTWENQAHDYPETPDDMPEFEPRGCPRGSTFSWYLYAPSRVKYPYLRSELAKLWREARSKYPTAYEAWASIASDPEKMRQYKQARGMGGFVRASWDEAAELVAASELYTAYTYGPDRNIGFSVIPAMSQISYAAGARFNQLMGGAQLSFYDWYADLPPASPQVWGEQTDVPESSDWYNAGYLMMWGSNIPLTRTPDSHFMTEVRYKGTKIVSVSPDYAQNVVFADRWLAPNVGTDGALAMAMGHVILQEYYVNNPQPFFLDYAKRFTDMPFVVMLDEHEGRLEPGRMVNAHDLGEQIADAEFHYYVFDELTGTLVIPNGTLGDRYANQKNWNLKLKNTQTGADIDPALSFVEGADEIVSVAFPYFGDDAQSIYERKLPARRIRFADGSVRLITTVHDLILAQYSVRRGFGDAARDFDDAECVYTPAWQERITGVKRADVISTAREFAENSLQTQGRSMIIMGAGINHWYHADTIYRTVLNLILFCATEGRNGGGWAHYVGQEKLRPEEGWATIMKAADWQKPPRLQNGTSFFYFATDQWRSDAIDTQDLVSPLRTPRYRNSADYNILAARLGWLPAYPTFNKSGARIVEEAREAGANTDDEIKAHLVQSLVNKHTDFAYADPDAPENFPRNLIVWRANLLGSSAKGNEYFFKYLLGTKNSVYEEEYRAAEPTEVKVRPEVTEGKLDLLITLDFRMATNALYSDVVLPTATWYEKTDMSSTDMHPYLHPFSPAVNPGWEAKTDWDIFRTLAHAVSKVATEAGLKPLDDVVAVPHMHDSPGEMAQPEGRILDWSRGECEPIPGKTMPQLVHVVRDYTQTYDKWIALGPSVRDNGIGCKGMNWDESAEYAQIAARNGVIEDSSLISYGLPSLYEAEHAIDAILRMSSTSNGEVAVKAFKKLEEHTGLDNLAVLAEGRREHKVTYKDMQIRPQEIITTPAFTGSNTNRRFTPFTLSTEEGIPFRTNTGRQTFYLDHELMQEWGEQLPVYKPTLAGTPLKQSLVRDERPEITLKYVTPHNKWSTHSMYFDNPQLLTLFRGGQTILMNEMDAAAIGVDDNDWVEMFNRNGVVASRVATTARLPRGVVYMHHAQDRHINVPFTELTGGRGSTHNGTTRVHVKPTHMIGGYGQLSYGFNYYGTTGNQRDILVVVRKMKKVEWHED